MHGASESDAYGMNAVPLILHMCCIYFTIQEEKNGLLEEGVRMCGL